MIKDALNQSTAVSWTIKLVHPSGFFLVQNMQCCWSYFFIAVVHITCPLIFMYLIYGPKSTEQMLPLIEQ